MKPGDPVHTPDAPALPDRMKGWASRFGTLKFRLMASITAVLLLVVGIPVGLFVHHLDRNYDEFSTDMLEVSSGLAYQYVLDGMMANDSSAIQRNLELLALEPRIQRVRIYRPSGTILYSSQPEEILQNVYQLTDPSFFNRTGDQIESFTKVGNVYTHHHPLYIQPVCTSCHVTPGAHIATLDIQASFFDSEHVYLYAKQLAISGGLLVIVALWVAMSLLYQGQIETRLRTLIGGFDELAEGNFNFTISIPGRHELAHLADRFNQTVDRLRVARKTEEEFYQEKLERADRLVTLGEIAAEIAHEVNNPAGIILTRAEYVRDEIEEQMPASPHVSDLDMIVRQTERIADITRSILHYARKPVHTFSATDLNEVVQRSVKIMEPRIKKRRIAVELALPEEPAVIRGSASQLEQVFCNLINNSLDAVQDGEGRLDVAISLQHDDAGVPFYRVAYRDNGPGIPPELRSMVFSPFFTTKADGKGTGLGLFIARNIITEHGGTLTLHAEETGGACFVIELERDDG